jgi:hypothetical protein
MATVDDQDQGYVPLAPPSQRKATPSAPLTTTPNSAPTGNDQGYTPLASQPAQTGQQQTAPPAQPSQGWGVQWPSGKVTMPQSTQDWGTVAANENLMGTIPGLRMQAEEARKRLDPAVAATADLAGSATSPSQLLNFFGGPEVAGAVHEGLKSYNNQPNWIPTAPAAEKIGADTALGAATGGFGRAGAAAAPALTRVGVSAGIPMGAGALGHVLFGHWDPYREAAQLGSDVLGTLGAHEAINEAGKWAGNLVNNPAARQAVKSLIFGAGSAARNAGGPTMYDQWIPGQ